jgi:DNA-binding transcriptional regulator YdaS (Cro superfamily)
MDNPVEMALLSCGCSQSELARRLGVNRTTVCQWKRRSEIPARNVLRVSEVTGVPAHLLSPKYFPRPTIVKEKA